MWPFKSVLSVHCTLQSLVTCSTCTFDKLTRMNRYLSGGGSLVQKMEVSECRDWSMARAAGAFRMRSSEAPADTVSRESASAMKPARGHLHQHSVDTINHLSSLQLYLDSPEWFSICLGLLCVHLSWPLCQHSDDGSPSLDRDIFTVALGKYH